MARIVGKPGAYHITFIAKYKFGDVVRFVLPGETVRDGRVVDITIQDNDEVVYVLDTGNNEWVSGVLDAHVLALV